MRTVVASVLAGAVAGLVSGAVVAVVLDGEDGAAPVGSVAAAVDAVRPGVVTVTVTLAPRASARGTVVETGQAGSGLVLDRDGHILTNWHVVEGATAIIVTTADGQDYPAALVGTDTPFTDVAVLQIDAAGLIPVRFGPSGALRAGDPVVAVGNALMQRGASVTAGVVSDAAAAFPREDYLQAPLIQTDAALNFGNSGGALVRLDGVVVGLTTTVARSTVEGEFVDGVGFALPSDVVEPIARAIVREGRYPRADLGVTESVTIDGFVAERFRLPVDHGTLIGTVARNGPLARAGIQAGAILLSIDGAALGPDLPYLNALSRLAPGAEVTVTYLQDGRERQVTVVASEWER